MSPISCKFPVEPTQFVTHRPRLSVNNDDDLLLPRRGKCQKEIFESGLIATCEVGNSISPAINLPSPVVARIQSGPPKNERKISDKIPRTCKISENIVPVPRLAAPLRSRAVSECPVSSPAEESMSFNICTEQVLSFGIPPAKAFVRSYRTRPGCLRPRSLSAS